MAKVLVVDDERGLRLTLSRFLEQDGHEVFCAEDFQQANRIISEQNLDIVVSDIIMPRHNGVELLSHIKNKRPFIKVILITGEPNVDTASDAVRMGAFDYLAKPIDRNALSIAVGKAEQVKKLEDENRLYRDFLESEVEKRTQQFEDYGKKLKYIADNTRNITGSKNIEELSNNVLQLLLSSTKSIAARMFAWESNSLKPVECIKYDSLPRPEPDSLCLGPFWQHVFYSQDEIAASDMLNNSCFDNSGWIEGKNNNILALPFRDSDDGFHALAVLQKDTEVGFNSEDLELCRIIASNSIEALKNIRLSEILVESEKKYRTVIDNSLTGIFVQSKDGIEYTNQRFLEITGSSDNIKETSVKRYFHDYLDEPKRSEIFDQFEKLIDGIKNNLQWELTITMSDKSRRYIDANCITIEYNNRPVIIGNLVDITDRVLYEQALKQSEERFRALTENSSDFISIYDADLRCKFVSDSVLKITGLDYEEMMGTTPLDFLHEDDAERIMMIFKETKKEEGAVIAMGEFNLRIGPNKWINAEGKLTNMLHIKGVEGLVFNGMDITRIKQADQEKRILEKQLQQAQKMEAVGRLAGGIAHDFNNLLTGITGNVSMVMMDISSNDPIFVSLGEVMKAAERASDLTRQLLAFSRKQIIELRILNLNELIRNLSNMFSRLLGENIKLEYRSKKRLGRIKADPGQIEQIIINLVVNARDAMPEGGVLTIETDDIELGEGVLRRHPKMKPGRYVTLRISDSGTGMDEETKKHIFEPFFTTKPVGKGTGLGLATVYGAVKQNRGVIEVKSDNESGTSFEVYFPKISQKAESINKGASDDLSQGNETVLVVEDDPMVKSIAIKILSRQGYNVLQASSGQEALEVVRNTEASIDLLLTDIVMPEMNGKELSEKLKSDYPNMKMLFTSGYTDDVIANHGILERGTNFIGKPYSPVSLAHKVRSVLDGE